MWVTENGIILKKIQTNDNNYIVSILSKNHGLQSFGIKISQKQKHERSILGMILPLVEFRFFTKPTNNIYTLKNLTLSPVLKSIPHDFNKQTILLFANELLIQTLRLPLQDNRIYDFVRTFILKIDENNAYLSNYPLFFAIKLTNYLGFSPQLPENENNNIFNLSTGKFEPQSLAKNETLNNELSSILLTFLINNEIPQTIFKRDKRNQLLKSLIQFYRLHTDFNPEIRSLDILINIFD